MKYLLAPCPFVVLLKSTNSFSYTKVNKLETSYYLDCMQQFGFPHNYIPSCLNVACRCNTFQSSKVTTYIQFIIRNVLRIKPAFFGIFFVHSLCVACIECQNSWKLDRDVLNSQLHIACFLYFYFQSSILRKTGQQFTSLKEGFYIIKLM